MLLKRVELSEAQEIFDLVQKNRSFLEVWLPWVRKTKHLGHTQRFLETVVQEYKNQQSFTFTIQVEEKICGICSLKDISKPKENAKIGY